MVNVYGPRERYLAKQLDRFPRLKRIAKKAYQRLSYWLHRPSEKVTATCPIQQVGWPGEDVFVGYYDKTPWSRDMERLLVHRASHGDQVEIGVFRLEDKTWQPLGTTKAWNWQQGAMAQWISEDCLIFNALEGECLGARLVAVGGGKQRFVPWPVQSLHPKGSRWLSLNYSRLHRIRPEYGYDVKARNFREDQAPDKDGIWLADRLSGQAELIVSLTELMAERPRSSMEEAEHKINHVMYSPEGARFVFMHRWVGPRGKYSRLYVSGEKENERRLLFDDRIVSHYNWRDENHLIVWGRTQTEGTGYFITDVRDGNRSFFGTKELQSYGDGHPSYSPNGRWIVTDTYPDKSRLQHLLLFDTRSGRLRRIASLFAPPAFEGPVRCDLHPRWSPDGRMVCVDSAHTGERHSYLIDVSHIVAAGE